MSNIMNTSVKKLCPFMESCYRKNPIHFSEMSHPHLEKLLVNQLDGPIEIPEILQFTCNDRSLLLDQLKVLQMVLRNEKEKHLKEMIERDKKQVVQTGEDKLEELNVEEEVLPNEDSEKVKLKKRNQDLSTNEPSAPKRMKDKSVKSESYIKEHHENTNNLQNNLISSTQGTSGSAKTSIMDLYQACDSEKSRNEIRRKAIHMMGRSGYTVSVVEPGEFAIKYALSAPYHMFFTRVEESKETFNQQFSITFPEILDISLGEIIHSLHINFMVDVGWLCLQYLLAGQHTDMLILYDNRVDDEKLNDNIAMLRVKPTSMFGSHHSKMMILQYKDGGIRVVISTANLYSDDWENRTQGLWISPHLPLLPKSANSSDGESPTGFKKDLVLYLKKYNYPVLTKWISTVLKADFSAVNVFLVASVPGTHTDTETDFWGHRKLAHVLSHHAILPSNASQWPIIAQSSSIGSLGPTYDSWLLKDLVPCMSRDTTKGLKSYPNFKFIYPSVENYKRSFDRRNLSCCLPYSTQVHSKQEWIKSYLYQWKATRIGRDRAMPHIKSYTRISPDFKSIPWFVLTSANLSKAAWGIQRRNHYIISYEAGVVFIPMLITGTTTFPVQEEEDPAVPVFPIPYDLPLRQYETSDEPFVSDIIGTLKNK